MKKDEVSKQLFNRFLTAWQEGKEPYFDADEIDCLLDSLEEADDWTYYDEIVQLGMRLHPAHLELKLRKCKLYLIRQKYVQALELLDSFAEAPNQDLDMLRLECYCNLNKLRKINSLLQSSELNQCSYLEPLYEHTVGILNDLDKTDEAKEFIKKGLLLYPDNLILKDELCYILEAEGKFTEAITLCNELIDKDPFSYETWFTLGRLYSMVGEFEKAVEAFDYALACDESDMELKILKSYCLFMNENYEQAIEAYQEIGADDESRERIKPLIAECYIKLGRFEDCYSILKDQIFGKQEEIDPTTYLNFIRCCVELERDREATVALNKAITAYPEDIRILSLQALIYIENGEEEEALKITEKIFNQIEAESDEEEAIELKDFFHNSINLYFSGNLNRAYKSYKKVFALHPNLPFMDIQRAMACFNLGDMELFNKYFNQTSSKEILEFIKITSMEQGRGRMVRHIPADKLTTEYLQNKDNNN